MTALHHIIIAVGYTLLAAACAVALPLLLPAIGPNAGAVIGGVVLVASALVHEVFARQEGEARLVDEVEYLRIRNAEFEVALEAAVNQISALRETVAEVGSKNDTVREDGRRSVETVIGEVKILQGLIEQFSAARVPGQSAAARSVAANQGGASVQSPAGPRDGIRPVPPDEATGNRRAISLVASEGAVITPPPGRQSIDSTAADPGSPPMATGLNDDEILTIVRDGLEKNRVDLVLQPIVKLPNRRRVFFEAFTRIRDENGAILVPDQYIGIAERDGLIVAIDNMMLFRCVQLVRRAQKRDHDIGFFCNISAHSLTDRHFFSNFVEFMADNASLAPNLIFEFPYATIANRDHDIEQHLRQLAQLGFRFSVDQVYGLNIDYDDLAKHHFKFIKMDAGILLKEVHEPSGQIAVQDIKRITDRHGIDLIVAKIETERALLELLDLRIDYGQGYLFGKPRLARPE